jgi:hypothetical protein
MKKCRTVSVALTFLALSSAPTAYADINCDGSYFPVRGGSESMPAHMHFGGGAPSGATGYLSSTDGCRIGTYPNGSQLSFPGPDQTSGFVRGVAEAGASSTCQSTSQIYFLLSGTGDNIMDASFTDNDNNHDWFFPGCHHD